MGPRLLRTTLDGQVQPVTDTNETYGGSWSTDGRIAVVADDGRRMLIVSPTGVRLATHVIAGEGFVAAAQPQWIPGSEWILLTCYEPRHVCVISAETGEIRGLRTDGQPPSERVPEGLALAGSSPRYVAPGHLGYVARSRNTVLAVPFDPERLTVHGEPQTVLEGVRREGAQAAMQLAVSVGGDMVFARGANAEIGQVVWADGTGKLDTLDYLPPRAYGAFFLSPDRQRLAVKVFPEVGPGQLWFVDLARRTQTQWVDEGISDGDEIFPGAWLPTSDTVVAALFGSRTRLLLIDARRGSGAGLLWEGEDIALIVFMVTRDGRMIFHMDRADGSGFYLALLSRDQVRAMPARPSETVPPLVDRPGPQFFPSISPDGRWLTYAANETGTLEVYAVRLPVAEDPIRISIDGGELPVWAPQGDGFYYRDGRRWYWVPYDDTAVEPFGTRELFLTGDFLNVAGPEHAVSADGKRLLLLHAAGHPSTSTLDLVIGWSTELAAGMGGAR